MEEQDSILIQKKMILIMSIVVLVLTAGIIYKTNENDISKIKVAKLEARAEKEKANEVEVLSTNIEFNTVDELFANLVTVYEKEDIVNDIISIEHTTYTAVTKVHEENKTSGENKNEIKEEQKVLSGEENTAKTKEPQVNYVSYKSLAEDNVPTEYKSVHEVKATAYCLCKKCCGKNPSDPYYGYTASGLKIVPGTGMKVIAVDTSVIPLGSKVYVEGLYGAWDYGYATAADTGSAIKNLKIDLYMDSHSDALAWGLKKVNVYVVE